MGAEESRGEQRRAEQRRAEQRRAEESRADQGRGEESRGLVPPLKVHERHKPVKTRRHTYDGIPMMVVHQPQLKSTSRQSSELVGEQREIRGGSGQRGRILPEKVHETQLPTYRIRASVSTSVCPSF